MSDQNSIEKQVEELIKMGNIPVEWRDIDTIKEKGRNPRKIKSVKFEELKKSIKDFPQMMRFRPGIVDENNELIAGNMRHRACKALGWPQFPVMSAKDLTQEQIKELIIKDNESFGAWDNKLLKEDWNTDLLREWGMDVRPLVDNGYITGKIVFATELEQMNNFLVLKFENDLDWLQVQTLLGLQKEYGQRQNGKPWNKGVGRVVDGKKAIKAIKESTLEL